MQGGGGPETRQEEGRELGRAFVEQDKPRIRLIAGIRIHQLTLPEALPFATKFLSEPRPICQEDGNTLGETSKLSASPDKLPVPALRRQTSSASHITLQSRRDRRVSSSSFRDAESNDRSGSQVAFSPEFTAPSVRARDSRPRAPTLAGEAIEHGGNQILQDSHDYGSMEEEAVVQQQGQRRLAPCFFVLKLSSSAATPRILENKERMLVPKPKRSHSDDKISTIKAKDSGVSLRKTVSPSSSSATVSSVASSPSRPSLTPSSSRGSVSRPKSSTPHNGPARTRTTSLTAALPPSAATRDGAGRGASPLTIPLIRSTSTRSSLVPGSVRPPEAASVRRPGLASPRLSMRGSPLVPSRSQGIPSVNDHTTSYPFPLIGSPKISFPLSPPSELSPSVPFYVSPIHHPSIHPGFMHLEPETDFARWLTVEEAAGNGMELELWYEEATQAEGGKIRWKKLEAISKFVDLTLLRKVEKGKPLPTNTIQIMLATDVNSVFYLPHPDEWAKGVRSPEKLHKPKQTVQGIVERSIRETRMKQGVGIGGLHQLVNLQSVVADTQRGIEALQTSIDELLARDVDHRRIRRDINQREERIKWIRSRTGDVEKTTREAQARITLFRQSLEGRRHNLTNARDQDELLIGSGSDLEHRIQAIGSQRANLQPVIHHWRAHHTQALDSLFPIVPLNPSTLLYSILGVPLPIPTGPKDPAPPLSIPASALPDGVLKVDERTTAAALGYVAMVVQLLGQLEGATGGVPYPITCAGSRSLVKDVVSIMTGPRSFPLFARGVERYRYEYAVFLLNKNIETLMQEANVRLLDLRHTLPNLKALLLTLSSPFPPPYHPSISSSTTYVGSRASSRQTSRTWSLPHGSPSSSTGRESPSSSRTKHLGAFSTPSPVRVAGRRSRLSRLSMERDGDGESEEESTVDDGDAEKADREVEAERSGIGR